MRDESLDGSKVADGWGFPIDLFHVSTFSGISQVILPGLGWDFHGTVGHQIFWLLFMVLLQNLFHFLLVVDYTSLKDCKTAKVFYRPTHPA